MRASLEKLYRRHRQGLYTLALSITRSPSEAEDAIQEAFVRLWKSDARPRGDRAAYLFAAVRNAAVEQVRRRVALPRQADPPVSIYDGRAVDPGSAAAGAELFQAASEAVENLASQQREVVIMRIYGGLTFAQIAQALGEPLPTVTSRYRRSMARIRAWMGMSNDR